MLAFWCLSWDRRAKLVAKIAKVADIERWSKCSRSSNATNVTITITISEQDLSDCWNEVGENCANDSNRSTDGLCWARAGDIDCEAFTWKFLKIKLEDSGKILLKEMRERRGCELAQAHGGHCIWFNLKHKLWFLAIADGDLSAQSFFEIELTFRCERFHLSQASRDHLIWSNYLQSICFMTERFYVLLLHIK